MAAKKQRPKSLKISHQQRRDGYGAYRAYAEAIIEAVQEDHPHLQMAVDPVVALNVTQAAYDDIERFKSFHLRNDGSARSDVVKRAAYFTKWTSKLRPVMFVRKDEDAAPEKDLALLANEILAVSYALELISSELGKDIALSEECYKELVYDLHYRELSADALLATYQLIVRLARTGKPNQMVRFKL